MSTRVRIMGASRQASTGWKAVHWRVEFEVEGTNGREVYRSLCGVYQAGGVADFSKPLIKTPHDLPEWVCETSLRDTVAGYFAHQVIGTMEQPDGSISDTLEVTDQIEDGYATDVLAWNYTGTTTLREHSHRQVQPMPTPVARREPAPSSPRSSTEPELKVGPHLRRVIDGAAWPKTDLFPARQEQADDCERLFEWADRHGQFERFLSSLQARPRQRDATISEIRSACFLESLGGRIISWEPMATTRAGEFEVQWPDGPVIFVEVKGPTWEDELTEKGEQRDARKLQPRFIDGDPHWVDTRVEVRYAALKTMGKLKTDRPNLLVVADHLFVSPVKDLEPGDLSAILADPEFTGLGGVLCIDANWLKDDGTGVGLRTVFEANPNSPRTTWEIPAQAVEALGAAPQSAR